LLLSTKNVTGNPLEGDIALSFTQHSHSKCGLLEWSQFKQTQVLNYQQASSHMSDLAVGCFYFHMCIGFASGNSMKLQSFTHKKEEYIPYKFTVDA